MKLFDEIDSQLINYCWLGLVAFIGGILGYFAKHGEPGNRKSLTEKIRAALLSIFTSMFVAYVTYEILFYVTESGNLSVAFSGLASFSGTNLLVAVEEGVISLTGDFLKRLLGRKL